MPSLKIQHNIKLNQSLSQKMIQSVNILQMNVQELSSYIEELSLENPMVELPQETPNDADEMRLRKLEWLSNLDEQNRAFYRYDREDADEPGMIDKISGRRTETLPELLRLQLLSGHYSQDEMKVFDYIIGSMDTRGYVTLTAADLADTFGLTHEDAASYLSVMRDLEPAGICAAGPRECLLKQIDKMEDSDWDIERKIIADHMELLGRNKLPLIAEKLGQPLDRIITALERIQNLQASTTLSIIPASVICEMMAGTTFLTCVSSVKSKSSKSSFIVQCLTFWLISMPDVSTVSYSIFRKSTCVPALSFAS